MSGDLGSWTIKSLRQFYTILHYAAQINSFHVALLFVSTCKCGKKVLRKPSIVKTTKNSLMGARRVRRYNNSQAPSVLKLCNQLVDRFLNNKSQI